MTKRRSIISFDKLSSEQKKKLEQDFPDGFLGNLTSIKTPTGEVLDALIWETDEIIYLVKINKAMFRTNINDDDEDDDYNGGDDMDSDIQVEDGDDVEDDDNDENE